MPNCHLPALVKGLPAESGLAQFLTAVISSKGAGKD
jgi:hypothetical protein